MQSILQFHRIGRDVRFQLQKKGKGSVHRIISASEDSSECSSGSSSPCSGRVDLEKQESFEGSECGRHTVHVPAGYATVNKPCPVQCQDDFGTRNARLVPGVSIEDEPRNGRKSKIFLVGQDPNNVDTDPRKWSLKHRIWAT